MTTVTVLRHAESNYPYDELTANGINQAILIARSLGRFDQLISSSYERAQQTIRLFGDNYSVDYRTDELNFKIKLPTAMDYTRYIFERHLEDLREAVEDFLSMVEEIGDERIVLVISHRVLMIGTYVLLKSGEIGENSSNLIDFDNLEGFNLLIREGRIIQLETC